MKPYGVYEAICTTIYTLLGALTLGQRIKNRGSRAGEHEQPNSPGRAEKTHSERIWGARGTVKRKILAGLKFGFGPERK